MQRVIPPRIGRWLFLCLCASLLALVALDSSGASHSISPPRLSLRTAASTTPAGTPDAAPSSVVKLRIDGPIEPILAEYLVNGIHEAGGEHASLILITMDTPGGLDTSMREIISAILASPVPVAIFVEPTSARAASAGFFILLSADVAAMAPGTETGAASPVFEMFGKTVEIDETMRKKVTNDATAFLRSYVAKRGRNPDLAVTAVIEAKAWSEKEAVDAKLVDLEASSENELLSKLDGRQVTRLDGSTVQLSLGHPAIREIGMTARERFLTRIVQPDVFFILLIVGVLGLYTEFTHPGLFAPGVIGGICIVLAMFAALNLPVNFEGLLLIVLALALFVLEAKYPTHGILGVGGVISMVLGALMLIRSPITGMGVSLATALGVAIPFALIVIFLARLVIKSRSWKVTTGKEELIGEEGEVRQAVGPSGTGMVFVHGELWQAASGGVAIPAGARIRVREVEGLLLHVEPVKSAR
jgi:membrane-bound serine protease (ClpP class)